MTLIYYSPLDTEKRYGYDLDSKKGPTVPFSISRNYQREWNMAGTIVRKSRVDDYALYMLENEKEAAKRFAEIPYNSSQEVPLANMYWSNLDTNKCYGWDLNSPEGPPTPPGKNYEVVWDNAGPKTRKSRVDDYVEHMTEYKKEAGERDADTPNFVSVKGRVSVGSAVFTIDCELSLRLEEDSRILIKYKREDHANAPDICHEIFDRDIVEIKLFKCKVHGLNALSKPKLKMYLALRAESTKGNGLMQYYYVGIYYPVPKSDQGRHSDEDLSYRNYITFEMESAVDSSISEFKHALMSSNFGATIGTATRESDLKMLTGAFYYHSLSSKYDGIDLYASSISIGNEVYDKKCDVSYQPDPGFPKISISYYHRMEKICRKFCSTSFTHLYCTPAKLPPAPGKINHYIVLEVWPDDENGLRPCDGSDDDDDEEDAITVVIEIPKKSDFQQLFPFLKNNEIFAAASHNDGLKAPRTTALMKDLGPIVRHNNRKAKLEHSRYLLAEPPYFEQSRRECFVCNRIYSYYNDEPVVMAPCCGRLCCIDCFDDKILSGEACQCGAAITTDSREIEILIRKRSEAEPYAQYILGMYIIDHAPSFDRTAYIEGEYEEGIEFISKAAQNQFVPACRMMASFYKDNIYQSRSKRTLTKQFLA